MEWGGGGRWWWWWRWLAGGGGGVRGAGAGTTIVEETERSIADDNAATSPYCFELFWHSSYCINKNDESSIAFSVISFSSHAAQNDA